MHEINISIRQAAIGTFYWLNYLNTCSEADLLAESSIRYPFIECLERKGINNIVLEEPHPIFKNRRVDLCIKSKKNNHNVAYVEFKFIRSDKLSQDEQQRIFNDVVRLLSIKCSNSSALCFFLICGAGQSFVSNFSKYRTPSEVYIDERTKKRREKTDGIYSKLFSFQKTKEPVFKKIDLSKSFFAQFNESFKKDYKIKQRDSLKNDLFTTTFKTARIDCTSIFESEYIPYRLAMWEIIL